MADGTIVLPPEARPQIGGQEAGWANQLGTALPQRPSEDPIFGEDSEISIDVGDGVSLSIGDDGELATPYIRENREPPPFNENLAEKIEDGTLATIAAEVVQGVDADILSRSSWIDQYNRGIDLLGTKIEEAGARGQRRNISRAGHPLMLEAMVKYQSGAEAEMLPAAGPAKVATIGRVTDEEQALANAFEDDFNYFLTEVATEYYPDTARMLMQQAFCGIGYKKIFRCPIRRRPVSESVLATDLIVSEEATDLANALRVTHTIQMLRADLKRLQIVGHYRDVDLGMPGVMMGLGRSPDRKMKEAEGISIIGFGRPEDQSYELLECDVDLDVDRHGIDGYYERRTPDGLPLPYKITVERNSQQCIGVRRNWRPEDRMCLKRNWYVKFGLVPSNLGYHDWGFLHLLGNQTRVLRSIWRLLIDAGMLNNFPGGVKTKNARTATNEIAPGPGEFVDIDVQMGTDLRTQFMPLPYKEPSAVFVQLSEIVKQDAMRLGGTVTLEVGEGRTNVPVGTIMSLIEQQVQVMAQVFKRNHRAQKDELRKLRELFAESPDDLWRLVRDRPRAPDAAVHQWAMAEEFMDMNLVPASDPNVPSSVHRMMSTNVLAMLAQQMPQAFDVPEVLKDALTAIGKDPDRFLVRPDAQQQQPPPDPRIIAKTIDAQTKQQQGIVEAQTDAAKLQVEREKIAVSAQESAAENETARQVEQTKQQADLVKLHHEAALNPPPSGIGGGAQVVGPNGQRMPIP